MESRGEEVRAALHRAGVPVGSHSEFVRFELQWSGRRDGLGDDGAWGIRHAAPRWGNSVAGEAWAEVDETSGDWWVVCADVHPSDMWILDERGRLWDAAAPSKCRGHFADVLPLPS